MIVVWTFGEMIESPVASAITADRAPAHARGRYQSAFGSMFGMAWILGPTLGTLVYAQNPAALWVACGVLGVVAAFISLTARRYPAPALEGSDERLDTPAPSG